MMRRLRSLAEENRCRRHRKIRQVHCHFQMELGTLEYDNPQQEWTENMMDTEFTFTATEAYGIYDGKTFGLYLPGAPVSSLPGDYVTGLKNMYQLNDESELPAYGLYNLEGNHAFLTE